MKKTILFSMSVGILFSAATLFGADAPKIMSLDLNNVYKNYSYAQIQEADIQKEAQQAQTEMNAMVQEGRAMFQDYQALQKKTQSEAFDDSVKDKFRKEAEIKKEALTLKEQNVNEFNRTTQQRISTKLQEVRADNLATIQEIAATIAKEKGADMIINSAGVNVLYVSPEYQIDAEAIKRLNATQIGAGTAEAKPATKASGRS